MYSEFLIEKTDASHELTNKKKQIMKDMERQKEMLEFSFNNYGLFNDTFGISSRQWRAPLLRGATE